MMIYMIMHCLYYNNMLHLWESQWSSSRHIMCVGIYASISNLEWQSLFLLANGMYLWFEAKLCIAYYALHSTAPPWKSRRWSSRSPAWTSWPLGLVAWDGDLYTLHKMCMAACRGLINGPSIHAKNFYLWYWELVTTHKQLDMAALFIAMIGDGPRKVITGQKCN